MGLIVKPSETPQRPGKAAIAEALGLYAVMRPIKHLHTVCPSAGSAASIMFMVVMASQHGVPGTGSGNP